MSQPENADEKESCPAEKSSQNVNSAGETASPVVVLDITNENIRPIYDAMCDKIRHEHDFIAHRLSWFTAAEAILFGSFASLIQNDDYERLIVGIGMFVAICSAIGIVCAVISQTMFINMRDGFIDDINKPSSDEIDINIKCEINKRHQLSSGKNSSPMRRRVHFLSVYSQVVVPFIFIGAWIAMYMIRHNAGANPKSGVSESKTKKDSSPKSNVSRSSGSKVPISSKK